MKTLLDLFEELEIGEKVQFENNKGCFELKKIKKIQNEKTI